MLPASIAATAGSEEMVSTAALVTAGTDSIVVWDTAATDSVAAWDMAVTDLAATASGDFPSGLALVTPSASGRFSDTVWA